QALELEPLYVRRDAVAEAAIGRPGHPPFVRGSEATREAWVIRQEHDDPRMEVCAKAIREDLERGVDALWLRCGSQHGVRILTAGDLALVLEGVDLSRISVCLEPEADALPMGAALVAVARHREVPLEA